MKRKLLFTASCTVLLAALFLSGCSLERTPEDENLQVPHRHLQTAQDSRIASFNEMCHRCVIGNEANSDLVIATYASSLKSDDLPAVLPFAIKTDPSLPEYLYQTESLNSEYERCLQKHISGGRTELGHLFIISPKTIARIARHFYQQKNNKDGAFWSRRMVNLSGQKNGYYFLAMEFINYRETRAIAAELLSESARLGNVNANVLVDRYVQPENVFTEYQKKHPLENSQDPEDFR